MTRPPIHPRTNLSIFKMTSLKTTSLLVVILAVFLCCGFATERVYISDFREKLFPTNIVFDLPVRSLLQCAVICEQDQSCVTFTYHHKVCRGHSVKVSSKDTFNYSQVARSYYARGLDWLDTYCQQKDMCADPFAGCFQQECKCLPTYFYSISSNTCVSSCDPSKATAPFQDYEGCAIYKNDLQENLGVTLEQCLQGCQDNDQCLSVDFHISTGYCYQKAVIARDAEFYTDWTEYNHYQKSCT